MQRVLGRAEGNTHDTVENCCQPQRSNHRHELRTPDCSPEKRKMGPHADDGHNREGGKNCGNVSPSIRRPVADEIGRKQHQLSMGEVEYTSCSVDQNQAKSDQCVKTTKSQPREQCRYNGIHFVPTLSVEGRPAIGPAESVGVLTTSGTAPPRLRPNSSDVRTSSVWPIIITAPASRHSTR